MDRGLREVVRMGADEGFAAALRGLAASGRVRHAWGHAGSEVEQGLEVWLVKIAGYGRAAYVRAAAAAARWAHPTALARAGEEAVAAGLGEEAPVPGGESEGVKLRRVEAWLAEPSTERRAAVQAMVDPSRRLTVWDLEIEAGGEFAWWWFFAAAELCALAVVRDELAGDDDDAGAERWTAPCCAGRAVLAAFKAARSREAEEDVEVAALGRAIAAAFVAEA
jgi:hypothetical protein